MNCPYCQSAETRVIDKRDLTDVSAIRRRRECLKCLKRFTTYERVEKIVLKVTKKDGRSEEYLREKLKSGIMKAAEKRPVSEEQAESLIDDIEIKLLNRKGTEISSADIGRMVLTRLKKLDQVAYLRFASVFLEFGELSDFKREISQL